MKISLNIIKQYVDLPQDLSIQQLCHDLTMSTVEVEHFEDLRSKYDKIIVGQILNIEAHPNADKLKVCSVNIGKSQPVQIVCGGSNLYEGEKVVVSEPGSSVVWHGEGEPVIIKETKMRGVSSYGMICGADEVGLLSLYPITQENQIVDLGEKGEPGENIADLLHLSDCILEIDNKSLTNRPDLYCHYGIARELAAIYGLTLKPLIDQDHRTDVEGLLKEITGKKVIDLEVENREDCGRYIALGIDGVSSKPSPSWLSSALGRLGAKSINAIVDITNYMMYVTGQPSHAFDKESVEDKIVVRNAKSGEKVELLDDSIVELHGDLIIADGKKPIALAGVMGGKIDSVVDTTTSIILEIANFSHTRVRKSVTAYNIRTDASVRFEKNLDKERVDQALALAICLFKQVFPECNIYGLEEYYPEKDPQTTVHVSADFLSKRSGRKVDEKVLREALTPLGFEFLSVKDSGDFHIGVPTWRGTGDVTLPEDILEEYARMVGYDNFEYEAPFVKLGPAVNQRDFELLSEIKKYLAHCGMNEIFTYPWVEDPYIDAVSDVSCCGGSGEHASGEHARDCAHAHLKLASPPAPDMARLRRSLVPGMLKAVVQNAKYFEEFSIFEVAQVYQKKEKEHQGELTEQDIHTPTKLCAAVVGEDPEELFFKLKGILEGMTSLPMGKLDFVSMAEYEKAKEKNKKRKHPDEDMGAAGDLNRFKCFDGDVRMVIQTRFGEKYTLVDLGMMGLVSVKTLADIGVKNLNIAMVEMDLEHLKVLNSVDSHYEPLPLYPLVEHDFSILVDENVSWESIKTTIGKHVRAIEFMEEYRGSQIPEGKKSVMLRVRFGSDEGTMSSEQIAEKAAQLMRKLSGGVGAELRA